MEFTVFYRKNGANHTSYITGVNARHAIHQFWRMVPNSDVTEIFSGHQPSLLVYALGKDEKPKRKSTIWRVIFDIQMDDISYPNAGQALIAIEHAIGVIGQLVDQSIKVEES